jgi:hypothetical protein
MVTQLEWYLEDGRPFVFAVECFPGILQTKKNIYKGKLADYYNSSKIQRPENSEDRGYHALLCVGITKRERG